MAKKKAKTTRRRVAPEIKTPEITPAQLSVVNWHQITAVEFADRLHALHNFDGLWTKPIQRDVVETNDTRATVWWTSHKDQKNDMKPRLLIVSSCATYNDGLGFGGHWDDRCFMSVGLWRY